MISEILNQIRVEHAKELLKEMQLRIVDISEMVGFTDVAHFLGYLGSWKEFQPMNTGIQSFSVSWKVFQNQRKV